MDSIVEINVEERQVMAKKRDYKKEYQEYHAKPQQKKNRAKRNKARKLMGLKVGDSREVDHKKPLSKGGSNSKTNLPENVRKAHSFRGGMDSVSFLAKQTEKKEIKQSERQLVRNSYRLLFLWAYLWLSKKERNTFIVWFDSKYANSWAYGMTTLYSGVMDKHSK